MTQGDEGRRRRRRSAARILLAAGLLATVLLIVASCGSGTTGSNSSSSMAVYATSSPPIDNWDPAIAANHSAVLGNVYETLTRYDPETGKATPLLATSWSSSKDGKTWTFKLRQGVTFHDGSAFDSGAVKFSVERTVRLNQGASYIWAAVKSIETPDPSTVVFHLSYSQPFDLITSANLGSYMYSPKSVKAGGDEWFQAGRECGTGPYKLRSQKTGTEVVLEKYQDYWGGWDGSHIDLAVTRYVSEATSRRQLVEGGDVQVTTEIPVDDLTAMAQNPEVVLKVQPSWVNHIVIFNTKQKPLDDVRVRQALCYAFPYEDAIVSARGEYATVATGPVVKGLWGYEEQTAAVTPYTYDPEKASQLLSAAGYPDGGLTLSCTLFSGEEANAKNAQLYQQSLAQLGIKLKLNSMPPGSAYEQLRSDDPPQSMIAASWWPTWATPYDILYNFYHTQDPIGFNFSYVADPKLDAAMDAADKLSGTDQAGAARDFAQVSKSVMDNAYGVYAYDEQSVAVVGKSVAGFEGFNAAYPFEVRFYDMSLVD